MHKVLRVKSNHILILSNLLLIISFLVFLILNSSAYKVPHGDLFQYINNGRLYISGQLPKNIQIPPLFPILIQILRNLYPESTFSEFRAAVFINIFSTIGSIIIINKLFFKEKKYFYATICTILYLFHPVVYLSALGTTPEPFFILSILISIYFWNIKKKTTIGLLFAVISSFIKVEGIILVGIYVTTALYKIHQRVTVNGIFTVLSINIVKRKLGFLITFLVFAIWQIFVFFQNRRYGNEAGSLYFSEIISMGISFQTKFFGNLPRVIFFPVDPLGPSTSTNILFIVTIVFMGLSLYLHIKNHNYLNLNITLFTVLYLTIHSIFPAYELRYFFVPFMLTSYLFFSLAPKKNYISVPIAVLLFIVGNVLQTNTTIHAHTNYYLNSKARYSIIWEWYENNVFPEESQVVIISTEPEFFLTQIQGGPYQKKLHADLPVFPYSISKNGITYHFYNMQNVLEWKCNGHECLNNLPIHSADNTYVFYVEETEYTADTVTIHSDWDKNMKKYIDSLSIFNTYPIVVYDNKNKVNLRQIYYK